MYTFVCKDLKSQPFFFFKLACVYALYNNTIDFTFVSEIQSLDCNHIDLVFQTGFRKVKTTLPFTDLE